ncbi:MAG TPA: hypothetical protein GX507_10035, partial [Clostridia bacterium]|nr:hypothetical protein [Clostridia bacterium]
LIVPARVALQFSLHMGERFDRLFQDVSRNSAGPTLSLAVVVAGVKTPVRYLFELSLELLKEAKWHFRRGDKHQGTLDIAVMSSFATFTDSIKSYRQRTLTKNGVKLTQRPFTFAQLRSFCDAVTLLRNFAAGPGKGWYYQLGRVATDFGEQVAELFFDYQYARLSDESRSIVNRAWPLLGGNGDRARMFNRGKDGLVCPWLDVMELWDYVGGRGENG